MPHPDNQPDGFKYDPETEDACPTCGGPGKKWQTRLGQTVCDECWLDVAMDEQHHKFSMAKSAVHPSRPKASGPPPGVRHNSRSVPPLTTRTSKRPSGGDLDALGIKGSRAEDHPKCRTDWKRACRELLRPSQNSICLICGHVFYHAAMGKCSRCGGTCVLRNDHEMDLMQRRPSFDLGE